MARKLRLGLLGTGVAARELYLPAFERLRDRIEFVACASRRRSRALAFARLAGIPHVAASADELFAMAEIDAVFISLPIHLQPRFVLAALTAGKAVMSEKPIAPTVAAGRRLVKAATRFSPPWLVAENYAFMPSVRQLQAWVERGRLGGIRLVEAAMTAWLDRSNPFFRTAWRARPEHRGFIVDAGVHLAHVVRRCFGPPVKVSSLTACFNPALPPIDTAVAVLEFASGALGTWTTCFTARREGPLVRVCGDRATAELYRDRTVLRPANGPESIFVSETDSYEAQFRHFADVVVKGVPVAVTPRDALADLAFVESIVRAR
ncbi:MAG: oxidoreductase domain protein [Acidobacteria bacterium]|nr:oxidoreductase domain protein [Acidobacteriota bacterium]